MNKEFNNFNNIKNVYFGLSTESKHLYDFFVKKGSVNFGFYDDSIKEGVTGQLQDGINLLNNGESYHQIICSSKKVSRKIVNEIINYCYLNKVNLLLLPDENESLSKNFTSIYINGIVAYQLDAKPLDKKINKFLKRSFDVFFSLMVFIFILSWLFPLLALLIKTGSRGPVLFIQKRNGLNNTEFNCLKFRTMFLNDDCDVKQARVGDDRVTKIGKFLRKTSIDEFPQFINVLKGNMSVVGPRPHMIKHNQMYAELIENYDHRSFVKPGITGLAQVLGYRGETESDLFLMKIRVRMDIFYINNWSFFLDLKLVFKTILNVFFPSKNAF